MIRALYKALLRSPRFRGRHRLEAMLRSLLMPAVDVVDGLRMELDPQEWLQIHLLSGGSMEPRTVELFRRLLRPGDTCIDVGAHVGFHALCAAQWVGPQGRVIAIDPQPYNAAKLLTNAQLNGLAHVVVVCAAVGGHDGTIVLHDQKRNDKARLSLAGGGIGDVATSFEAPIVRLDSLAQRHGVGSVRLLKVDVEGYEPQVLAGAAALLGSVENLVFELLPETDPVEAARMLDGLRARGFTLRTVDGEPWRLGDNLPEWNVWAGRQTDLA